jgi:hypothetical protein
MPESIIYAFKVIDIQQKKGKRRFITLTFIRLLFQAEAQEETVGQTSQWIQVIHRGE